ncbi:MAG: tRNA uridine-5-carboxymethylaminomethyl(34) synthesis GTPase MnmE, partial [Clostridia bacterium]
FKAPFSYTGEDVVEFQCHGGDFLADNILNALIKSGATLAENGEFSKRAFLNGKISLDKAEAVIDIINAESEAELKAGYSLMSGQLKNKIVVLQNELTNCLAGIEVALDYPEHVIEYETMKRVKSKVSDVKEEIAEVLKGAESGKYIAYGINVAIVGRPNVGKSSLLNALIGQERAIVTNIEGTTRDTIKETVSHKGIKINFIDTAGLRKSEDEIEKIGIERSKKQFDEADLILFVLDFSSKISEEELEYIKLLKNKNYLIIINKSDKKQQLMLNFDEYLLISALKKENVELIKDKILDKIIKNKINFSGIVLSNARQIEALQNAEKFCEETVLICEKQSADIVSLLCKKVWNELGKITGETENENIIDAIFSKFCLGK